MESRAHGRRRIEIRDLVLIALLAAVGGVLSAYVGYIGNLVNRLFGVPFGAGQLMAGLHVVWAVLARLLVGRFGAGTLTGVIKGAVELFAGGTHGVVILLVSAVQGVLVDVGMEITQRPRRGVAMAVGAVAAASNVFVFQAIYLSGVPLPFILGMAGLALVSGATLGGYLGFDLAGLLVDARLAPAVPGLAAARAGRGRLAATAVVAALLLGGAAYYFAAVAEPFAPGDRARIEGMVDAPYTFRYEQWVDDEVTITAELRGSVTHEAARPYTGVPLVKVVERAVPRAGATRVRIVADDGYEAIVPLSTLEAHGERLLLCLEGGRLHVVAGELDAAHWVRRVHRIAVE